MNGLRTLRKSKKFLLKEVAADLNLSVSTLSAYERGTREPNLATLKKLSEYFECPIEALL